MTPPVFVSCVTYIYVKVQLQVPAVDYYHYSIELFAMNPMMYYARFLLSISRGAEHLVCLCATAADMFGHIRTSQAMDIIWNSGSIVSTVSLEEEGAGLEHCFVV